MKQFHVYIMANSSRMLYTGMTNDIERRVYQHRTKQGSRHTSTYNITRLVYVEPARDASSAIMREKQIKGWLRRRKIALIESLNPGWRDLAEDWFDLEGEGSARESAVREVVAAETLRFAQGDGETLSALVRR